MVIKQITKSTGLFELFSLRATFIGSVKKIFDRKFSYFAPKIKIKCISREKFLVYITTMLCKNKVMNLTQVSVMGSFFPFFDVKLCKNLSI